MARRTWRMRDGVRAEQRGESHQQQSLLARRQITRLRDILVVLGQPPHALDDTSIDRARIKEQVAPTGMWLVATAQALRAGKIDKETATFTGRRHQRQRRRPVLELARRPLDL